MNLSRYWVAPFRQETVKTYPLDNAKLPLGDALKIVVVSDLHAGTPFMPMHRIQRIIDRANRLGGDLILVPGDLMAAPNRWQTPLDLAEVCAALGDLTAPLGVFAVMGNHDWWDDRTTQMTRGRAPKTIALLEEHGINVLQNDAICLRDNIWLAGIESQFAYWGPSRQHSGAHDLDAALEPIPEGALTILAAHEPDIFAQLPDRVDLTISGHTHGGQIQIFGQTPVVPSAYGSRYAYGHICDGSKNLIVSGGLGCSKLPLRFGVVPEIVEIILTSPA